jgi:uncharacterized membrane protein
MPADSTRIPPSPPSSGLSDRPLEEPVETTPERLTVAGRLRAYLLAGILVTAPIAITIYIAWVVIEAVDNFVSRVVPSGYLPNAVPGIGLVLIIVLLMLVGMFTAGYIGRMVGLGAESVLGRMPVIRSIYGATKQIFETLFASKSTAFREVVLVEWPRRESWTVGFITGAAPQEVRDGNAQDLVSVFIPTTPNPTGGYLIFVPRADLRPLEMSVEEGLKMVVSTGLVMPVPRNVTAREPIPSAEA